MRRSDGSIELHEEFAGIFPMFCPGTTRFRVRLPEGGLIITDSLFHKLSERVFEDIKSDGCADDFIQYKVKGLWGIMDGNLNEVTPPVFEKMETLWRDDADIR